jgi:uncharacterized protein YndB with AHSA1/START domain
MANPTVQVRVTRHFDDSMERVFNAWFDAETAAKWLFATPTGQMVRAKIDPRVGGSFLFVDRRNGEDIEHTGDYVEIVPPRRLVFDFGVPKYTTEKSRVTIEIAPEESGCQLTLTHDAVWADYETRTTQGWNMLLDGLAATLKASA